MRLLLLLLVPALAACTSDSRWAAPPAVVQPPSHAVSDPSPPVIDRPFHAVLSREEAPLVSAVRNRSRDRVLILGLWADGRLVWSEDPVFGGPPYHEDRLDPARLRDVLRGFDRLFDRWEGPVLEYHPPGASHVELVCLVGGRDRRLASWHESFERNPEMVVTGMDVERLEGGSRARVLAGLDPDYRRFRVLWRDVRSLMRGLLPVEARPAVSPTPILPAPR